jgi:hypothetical protein
MERLMAVPGAGSRLALALLLNLIEAERDRLRAALADQR